jgi:hypothetical protein
MELKNILYLQLKFFNDLDYTFKCLTRGAVWNLEYKLFVEKTTLNTAQTWPYTP